MGRLPIGCMGWTTAECLHVCFPQSEKQPSLTHLPSSLTLCGCPRGRAWRGCERRGLALGASSMHGHPTGLFITASPLALLLASASSVSGLSLCSFSWSLCWAASLSAGDRGSKNGSGVYNQGTLGAHFEKHPQKRSKPLKIINLTLRIQFGESPENYLKLSFFCQIIIQFPKWSWTYGIIKIIGTCFRPICCAYACPGNALWEIIQTFPTALCNLVSPR
jgi:hypothetical protein